MDSPRLNLLDEALIRIRDPAGQTLRLSLPQLFVALGQDVVRDYPALRPHQRHPWHALLVQLAALALHEAGETTPWNDAEDWHAALLALTPEHPDGCAWSLIAPHDQPAFLQAPVPGGKLEGWKDIATPDALDMLVTSKNHDLKGERMRQAEADDWLFALVSLQTQEGVLGNGKYGIARMNGGYGNRPAVGVSPAGGVGMRWRRDIAALIDARNDIAETIGFAEEGGVALVWLSQWEGAESISVSRLDPFFVEICRRVRLIGQGGVVISAKDSTSKKRRIDADTRNGVMGDAWIPVDVAEGKSFKLTGSGFNYGTAVKLLWGPEYRKSIAQALRAEDGTLGISLLAQGVARAQGGTEGYHERRIPLSRKSIGWLRAGKHDLLAAIGAERVKAIGVIRNQVLWPALTHLVDTGKSRAANEKTPESVKSKASDFCTDFERIEDARFFNDLNREIEAEDANAERLKWLIGLAGRAEAVLRNAFAIGPQCGERRYRARSRALSYFHSALRSDRHPDLALLAQYLRTQLAAEEAAS